MNGEPLPGLLDDPQFQLPDLPAFNDFHIAPLRDPAPQRHGHAPSPLEPVTGNAINAIHGARHGPQTDGLPEAKKTPNITPNDVLRARESKKPHLTISEIIEHNDGPDNLPAQLPSFVSLSAVEKSPIPTPTPLSAIQAPKRPRLDQDVDPTSHDFGRQLPRPSHKELPYARPAPLLPAMVTGLHEPPPSAALLPSMDPDRRPSVSRTVSAKIKVKDILMSSESESPLLIRPMPAEPMTEPSPPKPVDLGVHSTAEIKIPSVLYRAPCLAKEPCARRKRRKWTEAETQDLARGIKKHGASKWKQILEDPEFHFNDRTSVDLKDRYRTFPKEAPESSAPPTAATEGQLSQNAQPAERRKRRPWSSEEDARLIQGVERYGFQWTAIHDDSELDLGHRRATDLRDRIRNKFPDGYRYAETAPLKTRERDKPPEWHKGKRRLSSEVSNGAKAKASGEDTASKEKEKELPNAGVTLPSLTFNGDVDMDWDNRLAPLLPSMMTDWDDMDV